jgi:tetratricopeptide (TPR) repeat protein
LSVIEKAILLATIAGYAVHNFSVFDFLVSAMLLVIVMSYVSIETSSESPVLPPPGAPDIEQQVSLAAVGVIVLGLSMWFFVLSPLSSNLKLVTALTSSDVIVKRAAFESVIGTGRLGRIEAVEQFASAAAQVVVSPDLDQNSKMTFFTAALMAVNKEIDRTPTNVRMLMFRGTMEASAALFDQAVITFERMKELAPNRQDNLDQLAQVYQARKADGDLQKALDVSKHAYELSPNDTDAEFTYAVSLVYLDKLDEADALIKKVTDSQGSLSSRQSSEVFEAYKYVGEYGRIAEILEPVSLERPDDVTINISLAAAYLQNGQNQKAIAVLERFLANITDEDLKQQVKAVIAAIKAGKTDIFQ